VTEFGSSVTELSVPITFPRICWSVAPPSGQRLLAGRILQTIPDDKDCVRTVSDPTENGVLKQPATSLCLLLTAAPGNHCELPLRCKMIVHAVLCWCVGPLRRTNNSLHVFSHFTKQHCECSRRMYFSPRVSQMIDTVAHVQSCELNWDECTRFNK